MLGRNVEIVQSREPKHVIGAVNVNALLIISIIGAACNTNILVIQTYVEFQDNKCQKNPCSSRSVIKNKSMGTLVTMNETVPDLLFTER